MYTQFEISEQTMNVYVFIYSNKQHDHSRYHNINGTNMVNTGKNVRNNKIKERKIDR